MDFSYAHNDTSRPERPSRTANLNKLTISPLLEGIRKSAFERSIPVSSDETLQFLLVQARAINAKTILEVGAAIGASGIAVLQALPQARLITIEKNKDFLREAEQNFAKAGVEDRVTLFEGDAAEILPSLEMDCDLIFLDGPKVQYVKWLPHLKRLLKAGGVILADDILMYGWVNGEEPVPPKRRMLVEHIKEYIAAVQSDGGLLTYIADIGNGMAVSVKTDEC